MNIIKEAILRANKLGLKGIKVIDYLTPETDTEWPELKLITTLPRNLTASEDSD